jgi:G:T-mismatch repair DNA endonuclease (very short patch repair protein)
MITPTSEVRKHFTATDWRSLVVWECELRNPLDLQDRVRQFLDA